MAEILHEVVTFTGRVQGVGFRYATLQLAREFEVAGFVRNQTDGSVRLEVEGSRVEIDGFVAAIEERMHGYVRKTERASSRRPAQFQRFAIA